MIPAATLHGFMKTAALSPKPNAPWAPKPKPKPKPQQQQQQPQQPQQPQDEPIIGHETPPTSGWDYDTKVRPRFNILNKTLLYGPPIVAGLGALGVMSALNSASNFAAGSVGAVDRSLSDRYR